MERQADPFSHKKVYLVKPSCPFCGLPIERPKELETRRYGDMPLGSCGCGAVYAYDATGRNLGAALSEALVFGCNMDWDLAWQLTADDYMERLLERYDPSSHLIIPGGVYEGRKITGALYFIRLHEDFQEAVRDQVRKKLERARPVSAGRAVDPPAGRAFTRSQVEELVRNYRVEPLLDMARRDKRILRELQRLLYSSEDIIRRRAADLTGRAAAVIAGKDPGAVSNLLQQLLNSIANPGSSSWGAIDTVGEIIANSPELYAGYIPALFQFLEDGMLRPAVMRAVARAAGARPGLLKGSVYRLLPYLRDPDPATRGHAAELLGRIGAPEAGRDLETLLGDPQPVEIYRGGATGSTTVGRLAAEALERLRQ
ncbi:MAG: HEAT repeat domain-containing protein [Peptococcaceae bacterium]|nr:HEAT repeat domain-containing protein [Peptococcaceae bacterium]